MPALAHTGPAGTPEMLTVAEVAEVLGTTKYSVYRLIHAGILPAAETHGKHRYLVPAEAVQAYLARPSMSAVCAEETDPMWTAAEVARRLRCSVDTVRRLCASGHIRAHRFAGRTSHLRIPESAVQEYLHSHTTAASAAPAVPAAVSA